MPPRRSDHNERILREKLTQAIARAIQLRGLTQQQAASRMGVDQPTISGLLRGKRQFTADRLVHFLTMLGYDVHVSVDPTDVSRRGLVKFVTGQTGATDQN